MIHDHYELETSEQLLDYRFTSKGAKGDVFKLIQFTLISQEGVYNLALGDIDAASGEMNDSVITDNKDTERVLATVAVAVYHFCNRFPNAWVYATGNTASRTRLYGMGINKYFDTIIKEFVVYGRRDGNWEVYEKSNSYEAFAVRKNFKFEE